MKNIRMTFKNGKSASFNGVVSSMDSIVYNTSKYSIGDRKYEDIVIGFYTTIKIAKYIFIELRKVLTEKDLERITVADLSQYGGNDFAIFIPTEFISQFRIV